MTSFRREPPTVRIDGGKVRGLREGKSLTQLYVAEVAQVSVDTVSRWENNRTQAVRRENALGLARALEVELEEILFDTGAEDRVEDDSVRRTRRVRRVTAITAAIVLALLAASVLWNRLQPTPPVLEAVRQLPPYSPPGSQFPVVVDVRVLSGDGGKVVLREELPPGWSLLGAEPSPDQGPSTDGVVRWILSLAGGSTRVVYLVGAPPDARESSIHRFDGELVTPGTRVKPVPVAGGRRIDLEYIHWADEDADFQIGDGEVLQALERLEFAKGLGLDPQDLRRLWGAAEYEWNEAGGRFSIKRPR